MKVEQSYIARGEASTAAVALYCARTRRLLGVFRSRTETPGEGESRTLFLWEASPDFDGNPALFPECESDALPPFLEDFTRNCRTKPSTFLRFALDNHSAAQKAFLLLPLNRRGSADLSMERQVRTLLEEQQDNISGRAISLCLEGIPESLRARAEKLLTKACVSRFEKTLVHDLEVARGDERLAG